MLQLPLRLILRDDAIFDNFFAGSNAQSVAVLQIFSEPVIYCYGNEGSGRTHLLQACCHAHAFFYLPLTNHQELAPSVLESLENQPGVCIDDVDAVIGNRAWEEALFYFYNRARENGTKIAIAATVTPRQLHCVLPDLESRLSSALIVNIKHLSDDEKIQALQLRARRRGFLFSDEVAQYLIHHHSRGMQDLLEVLNVLDRASLAEKRKITIPFLKEVLS